MSQKILVAIATYNEIENVPSLLDAVFEAVPKAEVLIIDDDSPDGTGDWVRERSRSEPRLKLVQRAAKSGLGSAIADAMKYAIESGYDFLLNMDADWSHPPESIPDLISAMSSGEEKTVDVVIGSRYVPGGKISGWPVIRKWMSKGVNFYARFFLRLPVRDCSGSFRYYRVESLKKIDFSRIRSQGYSFFEEILFLLRKNHARFLEIPITFTDRRFGQSKINGKEALKALGIIARLGVLG